MLRKHNLGRDEKEFSWGFTWIYSRYTTMMRDEILDYFRD